MMGVIKHKTWRAGARIAAVVTAGLVAVTLQAQGPLTLYVSATDASGKPVTDLKADDFTMSENGVAGKIVSAEKFSLPIHLTIGLDNGPGSDQARGFYKNGLEGLVKNLPDDVEVTIIAMAPTPRMVVKSTAMKDVILKGINQVAPDEQSARFTDTLVEFTQRLDKEAKDKKLTYAPYLMIVSTTAAEASAYQRNDLEKAMGTFARLGARLSVAMTTTKNSASLSQRTSGSGGGSGDDVQDLNNGRQALIAIPLAKQTQGKYEALAQPSALQTILPEWGKMIASIHTKQANQYKLTIERPNGATGPLNNLDMRFKRQGLNGSISGDGRYSQ
jgi:hypothetical protein